MITLFYISAYCTFANFKNFVLFQMCNSTSYPENMETWKILLMLGKCCLVDDGKLEGKKFMSFEEIRCKKKSAFLLLCSLSQFPIT